MKVQEVKLENNQRRYLLVDDKGIPILPVAKYLKYIDNSEKSFNTQKTYCYSLKLYFEYLKEIDIDYRNVNINILSDFVGWLRNPYESNKIVNFKPTKAKRTEKTVNLTITVVTNFYDYIYRTEEIGNDMVDKLMKQVFTGGNRHYKDFLYHVNKDKPSSKNILKIKEPRHKIKILTKEEIQKVYNATTNIRDEFLIKLLFETGFRIGEALSLFIEDIIFDHNNGHRIKLVDRGELSNGASQKSGERTIHISQELIDLFDDYAYEVLDELEIDTNFVFVKLRGANKGKPLEYQDVSDLFKRLKKKTGIDVHAHLFRHTHATIYYQTTKDIKQVQERLGHSQIQTTMNMYLHPSDEDIRSNWEIAQPSFKITKGDTNDK
ncbi:tyrosine-type recombinase/integrase [Clostridium perfringens]|uniref:tyrosine-type recombinase/integrase n=1 Tax=Clostridium perfringens TaxID=1502 RepID=UPI00115B01E3|nr:tyrosine-type recombinase/integrase [Clostridium perfringens]EJT5920210.1 tyrosine-type recombinase/integrase [Clostridium perfringens]EJT6612674.1 tyrosine-type recombinase/integrase [Clostridium perfringens]ELC8436649.1 tyrosine-type recombinase/integrase [Clostridium perfringens]MDK0559710.1 tyrosine-type recombinase/integrase [Clostridium perfringens]MDK0860721.1 tyrosine-type recombinase/integrase [Clostridium perfringens]